MRDHWSLKHAAAVLGIHERRVTQSLDPAVDRIARLFRVDPKRTMLAILDAVDRLEPMSPDELSLRELMQTGRADLNETHPRRRG